MNDLTNILIILTAYSQGFFIITGGMDKENRSFIANKDESPPISTQLRDLSNHMKLLLSTTPVSMKIPEQESNLPLDNQVSCTDIVEPKTPVREQTEGAIESMNDNNPWQTYSARSTGMKV